jgi:tRNA(fMet)-specific endonuclease VapC
MLRYLLDTNICIYVIKRRPESLLERFNRNAGHLAISSITLAELMHGAEKSSDPERSLAVVEDFWAPRIISKSQRFCRHEEAAKEAAEKENAISKIDKIA